MEKIFKNSLPCFQFKLFENFQNHLEQAIFTRAGGVSPAPFDSLNVRFGIGDAANHVEENRFRIMRAMNAERMISANQTHSANVLLIDKETELQLFANNDAIIEVDSFDGFVTRQKDLLLMMQVADCQTIIFYDKKKQVLGLAHAGWKGLKQNISAEVIKKMNNHFASEPEDILVGIAPSLGPEHSEFSDPQSELGEEFLPFVRDKKVDLWKFSYWQLMNLGIEEDNIEIIKIDTADVGSRNEFFSYRRDNKITGRFAVTAMLK